MLKKMVLFAVCVTVLCASIQGASAGLFGTDEMVFNKKFVARLKPMMPYDQLVKIIGKEGRKAGEDGKSPIPTTRYHWDGGRKSALDVKVAAGKVLEVVVLSPKGQKFTLGKNGELVQL